MKIAILNDTHCGARNSAEWMIEYQERFYDEVFFPYLKSAGITSIIHAGDYFENRKTAASVQAISSNKIHFVDVLARWDISMDVIAGNHDAYFKNTNYLTSIETYLENDDITCYTYPITLNYDGVKICMIPWINSENYDDCIKEIEKTEAEICIGHFEFNGFPMQRGGQPCNSNHAVSPDIVKKFKTVLSGHFHTKSKKGNITYLGSQLEFTWADCDDPKYFHVIDTNTGKIEEIRNPISIFHKTSYDDYSLADCKGKFVQLERPSDVSDDVFLKVVKEIQEVAIEVKTIESTLDKENVEVDIENISETPELIRSYIDAIDTDFEKTVLNVMLEELYNEALKV